MFYDPICGMPVDERSPYRVVYGGVTYYFCSEECRNQFLNTLRDDTTTLKSNKMHCDTNDKAKHKHHRSHLRGHCC